MTEQGYRALRGAFLEGERISDLARAYAIPYSRAWAIAHGKILKPGEHTPRGASAGAWKDYGPTCKRGHPRPNVRDAKARRCRPCAALRAREAARRKRPSRGIEELFVVTNRLSFESWSHELNRLRFRAQVFVRVMEVKREREKLAERRQP